MLYNDTLLDRCCIAYNEALGTGCSPGRHVGVAAVLVHLAAEVMAYQELRGSVSSHELARLLLDAGKPAYEAPQETING